MWTFYFFNFNFIFWARRTCQDITRLGQMLTILFYTCLHQCPDPVCFRKGPKSGQIIWQRAILGWAAEAFLWYYFQLGQTHPWVGSVSNHNAFLLTLVNPRIVCFTVLNAFLTNPLRPYNMNPNLIYIYVSNFINSSGQKSGLSMPLITKNLVGLDLNLIAV